MKYTDEQEALLDAVSSLNSNLLAEAVAGAGKTTTAVQCAQRATGNVGFLAFNKHIAEELQTRLGGSARASTLHSLGNRAINKAAGANKVALDENKTTRLMRDIRPAWFFETKRGLGKTQEAKAAIQLARLCKITLSQESNPDHLADLVERFGVDLPDDNKRAGEALYGATLLVRACEAESSTIDFDDMVWLPTRLNLPLEQYDLLMVDEAQDMGRATQELALRSCVRGRLVPIGDRHQAINGFAGADPEAMDRIASSLAGSARGLTKRPLTVTFRCPRSVVAIANHLVPHLRAKEGAEEGIVRVVGDDEALSLCDAGTLVLSRRNASLMPLALRLIAKGIGVQIKGRDFGKGLIDLIGELKSANPVALIGELDLWKTRELERLERLDASETALQVITDRAAALQELASRASSIEALKSRINSLFGDDPNDANGKVILSSIHRSKGLEADRVIITDTKCIPLVLTCRSCRGTGKASGASAGDCHRCKGRGTRTKEWEYQQELNLAYVAVTRAKKELYFVEKIPSILGGEW